MVEQIMDKVAQDFACRIIISDLQAISPGYPTPTYRLSS